MTREKDSEGTDQSNLCESILSTDKSSADKIHIDRRAQSNSCNDIPSDRTEQQSEVSTDPTQVYSIYREDDIDTLLDDDDNDNNNNNNNDDNNNKKKDHKTTGDTSSHSGNVDKTNPIHEDRGGDSRQVDVDLGEGNTETHRTIRSVREEGVTSFEVLPDDDRMTTDEELEAGKYVGQASENVGDNAFAGRSNVEAGVGNEVDSTISFEAENGEIYIEVHDASNADKTQNVYEMYEDVNVPLTDEYLREKRPNVPNFNHKTLDGKLNIAPNAVNQMEDENDDVRNLVDETTIYISDQNTVVEDFEDEGVNSQQEFADTSDEYFYDPRIFIEDTDDDDGPDMDENVIEDADEEDGLEMSNGYVIEVTEDEDSIEDVDEDIAHGLNEENAIDDTDNDIVYGTDDEMVIEDTDNEFLMDGPDGEYIEDTDEETLVHLDVPNVIESADDTYGERMDDSSVNVIYETDEEDSEGDLVNEGDNVKTERKNTLDVDNSESVPSRNEEPLLHAELTDDKKKPGHQNTVPESNNLQTDTTKPLQYDRKKDQEADDEGDESDHAKDQGKPTDCKTQCSSADGSFKSSDRKTEGDGLVRDGMKILSHGSRDDSPGALGSPDGSGFVSDGTEEEDKVVRSSASKVSDEAEVAGGSVDDGRVRGSHTNKILNVHDHISNSVPEIDPELPADQEDTKSVSPEERPPEDSQTEDQSEEEEEVEETSNLVDRVTTSPLTVCSDDAGEDNDEWVFVKFILDKIRAIIWNITVFCFVCYAGMYLF
ncbi:protein PFC0760c-like isoform X2 [Eriocheir sinensis]|uniref:protein PFC0760c-like isoform X2 n=1 Tax=Eriocheir sinensis TaxID=95602 RepID=UPI0021C62AE0|nr:protein PFC0760c-like isoform X2 [Eriocheir sinensis]